MLPPGLSGGPRARAPLWRRVENTAGRSSSPPRSPSDRQLVTRKQHGVMGAFAGGGAGETTGSILLVFSLGSSVAGAPDRARAQARRLFRREPPLGALGVLELVEGVSRRTPWPPEVRLSAAAAPGARGATCFGPLGGCVVVHSQAMANWQLRSGGLRDAWAKRTSRTRGLDTGCGPSAPASEGPGSTCATSATPSEGPGRRGPIGNWGPEGSGTRGPIGNWGPEGSGTRGPAAGLRCG